jgi:hypothetical protein
MLWLSVPCFLEDGDGVRWTCDTAGHLWILLADIRCIAPERRLATHLQRHTRNEAGVSSQLFRFLTQSFKVPHLANHDTWHHHLVSATVQTGKEQGETYPIQLITIGVQDRRLACRSPRLRLSICRRGHCVRRRGGSFRS